MTTAFRMKTFPEIRDTMFALLRGLQGEEVDLNILAIVRAILELASHSDADQYIQINKLLNYFNLVKCKGDALDRRALDFGTFFFEPLRRNRARASTVKVAIGDGSLLTTARILYDVDIDISNTSFTVQAGQGEAFPSSGAAWLERGTARQERVVYTRSGDVFSVPLLLQYHHATYGEVTRIATQSALDSGISIGAVTADVIDGCGGAWPASGTIIFDRGTASEEKRAYTLSGDTFTFAGTTFGHLISSPVILSTFGSDRSIGTGLTVYSPATESSRQVNFTTLASGILRDGDLVSELIDAQCIVVGLDTNVGSGSVSKFNSAPFSGAVVTNPLPGVGGADQEDDDHYFFRLVSFISSLSRGTPVSIETLVLGLFDEVTNSRLSFAQVIEPVVPGVSLLYISDGSAGFSLAQQPFSGRDVIISDAAVGDARGHLHSSPPYRKMNSPIASRTPRVYLSVNRGTSSSVGVNYLEDTTQAMTVDAYIGMFLKSADDQFYEIASNTAIRFVVNAGGGTPSPGSYAIFDFDYVGSALIASTTTSVASNTLTDSIQAMTVNAYTGYYLLDSAETRWKILSNTATAFTLDANGASPVAGAYKLLFSPYSVPLIIGTDFNFNETNGDLELAVSLVAHDAVVASDDFALSQVGAYTYTTGLGALAQRVVNGDPTDFSDFPGIKSTGTQVLIAVPTVISPSFIINVLPKPGIDTQTLFPIVQLAVQSYVNGLGMGEDIINAEVVRLVKGLVGVADVHVDLPAGNYPIADGQLARVTANDVDVI